MRPGPLLSSIYEIAARAEKLIEGDAIVDLDVDYRRWAFRSRIGWTQAEDHEFNELLGSDLRARTRFADPSPGLIRLIRLVTWSSSAIAALKAAKATRPQSSCCR